MRRFNFRLEPLLRYRGHLAEQAQLNVAKIRFEIQACEERMARLEKTHADTAQELDEKVAAGLDVKRYHHFANYLTGIESTLESEIVLRKELQEKVEEKQKILHQRTIDKKALENLKNRRRDDYYKEMLALDQKVSDDMVIIRQAGGVGS